MPRQDGDPLTAPDQSTPTEQGWTSVAAPAADLPAALAGSEAPERILKAVEELNTIVEAFWLWIRDVHIDVVASIAHDQPGRNRTAPAFKPAIWSRGAFREVLADDPRLRTCDTHLKNVTQAMSRLVGTAGPSAFADDTYRRFMDLAVVFGSALHELESEVWNRLAGIDPLTGLATRPAMTRRLNIERERHARNGQPACVAILDLDRFKAINDTHGHAAGDTVLRSVASLLVANLRPYDAVFRYGGDEFVVCLPNADLRTAWAILERLRRKVNRWIVPVKDDITVLVTLSIGVAPLTRVGGGCGLDRADSALYEAKRLGRNTVVVVSD